LHYTVFGQTLDAAAHGSFRYIQFFRDSGEGSPAIILEMFDYLMIKVIKGDFFDNYFLSCRMSLTERVCPRF